MYSRLSADTALIFPVTKNDSATPEIPQSEVAETKSSVFSSLSRNDIVRAWNVPSGSLLTPLGQSTLLKTLIDNMPADALQTIPLSLESPGNLSSDSISQAHSASLYRISNVIPNTKAADNAGVVKRKSFTKPTPVNSDTNGIRRVNIIIYYYFLFNVSYAEQINSRKILLIRYLSHLSELVVSDPRFFCDSFLSFKLNLYRCGILLFYF
jgi:hypothetical protein